MELDFNKIAVKKTDNYPGRPTLVFLHDSFGCIELWRDFPFQLGELTQCNVLVYDRQGYGNSCPFTYKKRDQYYLELEADILKKLIEYWNLKEVILFGHSDGGSIALIAAGKYPERISGVITEGAHVFVEEITLKGIRAGVDQYEKGELKQRLEKYHGDKTEALFWAWASTWLNNDFKTWSIEHFLPQIQCPTLIIQGEEDEFGSLEQVYKTVSQIGEKANKLIIPNIGHNPHKECPDFILKRIKRFILTI